MKVKLKLNPGDRGTKKLVAQYGEKLVCVRYRYDEKRGMRLKTVETIVEEIPWTPPPPSNINVSIKTKVSEKDLHQQIRNAGGKWDRQSKVWTLTYSKVAALGLESRIVGQDKKSIC